MKKNQNKGYYVNKLYNDYPNIISYGDKFIKILKEEVKELDQVSCDIFNDIDKFIFSNIIYSNNTLKKYIY